MAAEERNAGPLYGTLKIPATKKYPNNGFIDMIYSQLLVSCYYTDTDTLNRKIEQRKSYQYKSKLM